jgi:hypothetical protein
MKLSFLMWLSTPITWIIAMMIVAGGARILHPGDRRPENRSRIVRGGPATSEAMGAALMFLSMAYRPNHAFVAKAQIRQHEDEDDDGEGGPDTSRKHLHRQLRRIRHGEKVDRLVWRLE